MSLPFPFSLLPLSGSKLGCSREKLHVDIFNCEDILSPVVVKELCEDKQC